MCILEGKCPKCGTRYSGWALESLRNQMCAYCGAALEMRKEGVLMGSGPSAFEADKQQADSNEDNSNTLRNKTLGFYLSIN
jgi:NAD-dependent SIR2 family protein deacetylase